MTEEEQDHFKNSAYNFMSYNINQPIRFLEIYNQTLSNILAEERHLVEHMQLLNVTCYLSVQKMYQSDIEGDIVSAIESNGTDLVGLLQVEIPSFFNEDVVMSLDQVYVAIEASFPSSYPSSRPSKTIPPSIASTTSAVISAIVGAAAVSSFRAQSL